MELAPEIYAMRWIRLWQLELIVQYKFSKYNNGNYDNGRPAKTDKVYLNRIKENGENAAANELKPKILSRCWSPANALYYRKFKSWKHLLFSLSLILRRYRQKCKWSRFFFFLTTYSTILSTSGYHIFFVVIQLNAWCFTFDNANDPKNWNSP